MLGRKILSILACGENSKTTNQFEIAVKREKNDFKYPKIILRIL